MMQNKAQPAPRRRRGSDHFDVIILGAGLAGLSLARQLRLDSARRILLIDKRTRLPAPDQKVGEATVQVSGYYFSKVLGLEEYLFREHLMKYNLRFYWKTAGRSNAAFEDYSQAYIQKLSNIASYQLDRNKLEAELLRCLRRERGVKLLAPARIERVELAEPEAASNPPSDDHRVDVEVNGEKRSFYARWVIDATGRARLLARQRQLQRENPIHHASVFLWVDGLLNVEELTELSPREVRLKRDRAAIGHLPLWLATNHFCGEGFWFWVIPLQGKTSLGLVFDTAVLDPRSVNTAEKLITWICREFPLFTRDLPQRRIDHFAGMPSYSYDCAQTLSASRWAMTGMSGRFSDPLYSPGGDLIAIHNTLIADAIATADDGELAGKVRAYEQLLRSVYEAYVPSYAESYNVLGDPDAFTLKYTWELTIYFAFYVFPFINDLFTDRRFLLTFFNRFSRLGPLNRNLQRFLAAYARWSQENLPPIACPVFHDFPDLGPLAMAEKTFYRVGLTVDEAKTVLAQQLTNIEELCRFCLAYLASMVLDEPAAVLDRGFVEAIELASFGFEPAAIRQLWRQHGGSRERYPWSFDATVLEKFRQARGLGGRTATKVVAP